MVFPEMGTEWISTTIITVINFQVNFKHISWSFIDLPRCWVIKAFCAEPPSEHNKQGQKRCDPNVAIMMQAFCCEVS
jgi:hypothetical protein